MNRILMMQNDHSAHRSIHCLREADGSVNIPGSCFDLLNQMCLIHGSTAEGRQKAFASRTGYRIKVPVMISEKTEEIYFPLRSPKSDECVWILYNELFAWHAEGDGCRLVFCNGMHAYIPYDYRMVRKQYQRCRKYLNMLADERKTEPPEKPESLKNMLKTGKKETVFFR